MCGAVTGRLTTGCDVQMLRAQTDAKSKGFTDVLYLDSVHKRYLEEVSSCNVFVVKGGVVATPGTRGTILPGITRKSVIELARDRGHKVDHHRLTRVLQAKTLVFLCGLSCQFARVTVVVHCMIFW